MGISCITTQCGNCYSITTSEIIHILQNYIGYGGLELQEMAEKELCISKLIEQFDIFYKDIKRILYDNFKLKQKLNTYDDKCLVKEIIGHISGDINNYYRYSLIAILKVLEKTKLKIQSYDERMINKKNFEGMATYLHLLLLHIYEFASEVATVKTGKKYSRIYSRKRLLAKEVYDLAQRLPKAQIYTNEMTYIYESIFFIRQAIELKVLETLCIEMIINKKSLRPIKITPNIFINLLDDDNVKLRDINGAVKVLDINLIKKIHSWTNTFVHSGYVHWFWEIEFIYMTLQEFIFCSIEIDKEYLKQIPDKIRQYIKPNQRLDAEIIMSKKYDQLINE